MIWLAAPAVLLCLAAAPAGAASFDCAKARLSDEKAVCADPNLSALDSEMGGLWFAYERIPLLMGGSAARRDEAHAFLSERGRCAGDIACLTRAYETRIAALRKNLAGALDALTRQANSDGAPAPQPVTDQVSSYLKQCRTLGGTPRGNQWPFMMSADLDRDGQPDYVLNTQNLACDGAATAYCANDGCDIAVSLSTAGYRPEGLRGSDPVLAQDAKATVLELWVDRFQCPDAAPEAACWGTWKWDGAKLKASYAVRAR
ncbi:lysozyme inhibitor LprI family protein [Ancylobacter sp. G4_0304]|uniref:lysozyme inhibitor LprI family protein n=1 Tax=Ancylobacter sp. G4_0304 TaxID=3114289 RepID=UPI0039C5D172